MLILQIEECLSNKHFEMKFDHFIEYDSYKTVVMSIEFIKYPCHKYNINIIHAYCTCDMTICIFEIVR